jgi:hypothetical protein
MAEVMLEGNPDDLVAIAILARIYVQYLKQPALADKLLRRIFAAKDFQPHQVEALDRLAEAFAKSKSDDVKAGRLWRKLLEGASISPEQKIAVQGRLERWAANVPAD